MAFHKTDGAKFYYSPTIASPDTINALSDAAAIAYFTAIANWIEVGEVEQLGEIGDQAQLVEFSSLGNRRVRGVKGTKNAGVQSLVCGRDPLDLGQIAMNTAAATDYNFPFRIVLADVPPGTTTPSKQFYAGLIMSNPTQHGSVNTVTRRTFGVKINTSVYEQLAT